MRGPWWWEPNPLGYFDDAEEFRQHMRSLPSWSWFRNQPDARVFTDSELIFAAIGICRFFGVDDDDDCVCQEVQRILQAHSREVVRS